MITIKQNANAFGNALNLFGLTLLRDKPDIAHKFIDVIPMKRVAEQSEVASMVTYLASKEAAFVTGQVISVNGGSTML